MSENIFILPNPQVLLTPSIKDLSFLPSNQIYYCLSSSGSTSERTKWIVLSEKSLLVAAQAFNQFFTLGKQQVWASILPSYHISGLMPKIRAHLGGYQLLNWTGGWSPQLIYQFLCDNQVTGISVVPTQLYDWVQLGLLAPAKLQYLIVGGAPISEDLFNQAQRLGWPIYLTYGMTESSALFAVRQSLETPYELLPHVQFEWHHGGQLAIKTLSLFTGILEYQSGPQKWIWEWPKLNENGFWLTADQILEVDKKHFFLRGRLDEFIKIKGEGVYLEDIRTMWDRYIQGLNISQAPLIVACEQGRTGYELVLVVDPRDYNLVIPCQQQWNNQQPKYLNLRIVSLEATLWPRSALGKIQWVALKKLIC